MSFAGMGGYWPYLITCPGFILLTQSSLGHTKPVAGPGWCHWEESGPGPHRLWARGGSRRILGWGGAELFPEEEVKTWP